MSTNFNTEFLGIKERYVEVEHVEQAEEGFLVELGTRLRKVMCPGCKTKTNKVHGYRVQRIRGRLIEERPVELLLRKRRYKCLDCGHTFYESFQFVDRYQRHTVSLNQQALTYVAEHSFTQAARLTGTSVSRLIRLFDKRRMPIRRQLPRVIAVDEFKGDADNVKFQTIIVDVEKKEIIEVLPDRRVETLEKYFKS
jgi:transposase